MKGIFYNEHIIAKRLTFFEKALNVIGDAVYIFDSERKIVYVNAIASEALGYTNDEILEQGLDFIDKDISHEQFATYSDELSKSSKVTFESWHTKKDGSSFPVEVTVYAYEYEGELYSFTYAKDITQKNIIEKALAKARSQYRILVESTTDIVARYDLECRRTFANQALLKITGKPMSEMLGRRMSEEIPCDSVLGYEMRMREAMHLGVAREYELHIPNPNNNHTKYQHISIVPEYDENHNIVGVMCWSRDITHTKETEMRLATIVENLPDMICRLDEHGRFVFASPSVARNFSMSEEALLGKSILELGTNDKSRDRYLHEIFSKTLHTGEQTSCEVEWGIQNGKKQFQVRFVPEKNENNLVVSVLCIASDITESKRIQEMMNAREQAFRAIAENAPMLILRYDTRCRRVYLNSAFERLTGLQNSHLLGFTPEEVPTLPKAENEKLIASINHVLQTVETIEDDIVFDHTDGRISSFHNIYAPEFDSKGKIVSVLCMAYDTTKLKTIELERKKTEQILARTASQLSALINTIPDIIWMKDTNGVYLTCNPALEKFFGVSKRGFIGKTDYSIMDDASADMCKQSDIAAMNNSGVSFSEETIIDSNGSKLILEIKKVGVRDESDNLIGIMGIASDITEQKKYEHGLLKQVEIEKRQSQFFAVAPGFFYTLLLHDGVYSMPFASSGITELFGLDPQAVMDDIGVFVATTHPDDLEMVFRKTEESAQNMTPYNVEYRSIHPTKGLQWIECKSLPSRTKDGDIRWDGIKIDITERKLAEFALKDALEFTSGVINAIPDLLFETDIDGNYLNIWAHDEELLAEQKEILLNSSISKVLSAEAAKICMDAIREADESGLSLGHAISIELPGGKRWFELSISKKLGSNHYADSFIVLSRDITERKQAEEQLAAKEREFRTLVENLPDNIIRYDKQCRAIYVSPMMERVIGHQAVAHLMGITPIESDPEDAFDSARYQQTLEQVLNSGEIVEIETKMLSPSGKREFHLIRFIAERDSKGEICGAIVIGRDITEKREAEKTLEMFGHALNHSAESVFVVNFETAQFVYVNDTAARILEYSREELTGGMGILDIGPGVTMEFLAEHFQDIKTKGAVKLETIHRSKSGRIYPIDVDAYYFKYDGKEYSLVFTRDITERKLQEEMLQMLNFSINSSSESVFIIDWDSAKFVYVNDTAAKILEYTKEELLDGMSVFDIDPEFKSEQWLAHVDVMKANKNLTTETKHRSKYGRIYPVEVSAHYTLYNGKEYNLAITRDITEKKEAENKLKILNHSLDSSSDAAYLIDIDTGCFTYANETAAKTLGYSVEELTSGMGVLDIDPDFDMSFFHVHIRELADVKSMLFETRHKTKDGHIYPVEIRSNYFIYDDKHHVLSFSRDITERKALQESLKNRERAFRGIAENTPDTIARYDRGCRRLYANEALAKSMGMCTEELIGLKPTSHADTAQARAYEEAIKRVIDSGIEEEMELSCHGITSHMHIVPERDMAGSIKNVLCVGRDITKLKEIEQKLQENEKVLQDAQRIAKVGSWELDFKTSKLSWSDEVYRIFELDHEKFGASYEAFLSVIHPEDREFVNDSFNSAAENKTKYDITHRLLMSDGRVKFVHEMCNTEYDGDTPARAVGTVQDITDMREIEERVEFLAYHDHLTGLPNRLLAKDRAEQMMARAKRSGTRAAILFADLDNFKTVNDSMGHETGDKLLKLVSGRLCGCVRESDTVTRQGGDEFLILLPDLEDTDCAASAAVKILREFKEPFCIDGEMFSSSVSIGIAMFPEDGESFDTLLKKADTAMYEAKEAGKNLYCFFTHEMNEEIIKSMQIHNDLKVALDKCQLELYYQPQVDIPNGTLVGAEALLRWKHPERGFIPPMEFIPAAESGGLIVEIGEWVIRQACFQAAKWQADGHPPILIAVNISAVQFKRGDLEQTVKQALNDSGLEPCYLELELTESIIIKDTESVLETVRRLKDIGIKLSIDDFGTGYSSLAYLRRFAVDKLKIDRSFVMDLIHDAEDAAIVRAIIQMAKSLNLRTIAEGIETRDVLESLAEHGCDEAQGYFFSKPCPVSDFEKYLKNGLNNS